MRRLLGEIAAMLMWYVVMLVFTGLLVWPTVETQLSIRKERRLHRRTRKG